MSRPPVNPEKSAAGIAVDPITLDRVIPESRRADGSVRKQIKIRPGFTPQEDIRRFRGTKQAQMDSNALPKGHVVGWAPPPKSTAPAADAAAPLSKAAKKNAKRKEKREKEKEDVPENWDDDEDGKTPTSSNKADAATTKDASPDDALASKLEKLEVK